MIGCDVMVTGSNSQVLKVNICFWNLHVTLMLMAKAIAVRHKKGR